MKKFTRRALNHAAIEGMKRKNMQIDEEDYQDEYQAKNSKFL